MKKVLLILLAIITTYAYSSETGKIRLFLFENSIPLKNIKIIVDNKTFFTNEYGQVEIVSSKPALTIKIIKNNKTYIQKLKNFPNFTAIYYLDIQKGKVVLDKDIPYTVKNKKEKKLKNIKKEEKENKIFKGKLLVKVVSFENNKPIQNAKIFVKGYPNECITDKKGECLLELKAKKISISIIHPKFNSRVVDDIYLIPNKTVKQTIKITPLSLELPEFVILAPHIKGSIAEVISQQKKVADIVDIIGSEQFEKAGDSDASSAVKRTSGITVLDGKYVYIRGLGGRYSITLLNNSVLPSPEPTKRVVPLDIFPTGVLKNIVIKKTYSADLPAYFAAGAVILNTKDVPNKFFVDLSLSLKYNSQTTFKKGNSYKGGSLDFLGIDDGTRELPFPDKDQYTFDELKQYKTRFKNNSNTYTKTIPFGFGFNIAFGNSKEFKDKDLKLGYLSSFMYDNDWQKVEIERTIYNLDTTGLKFNNGGVYDNTVNNIKTAFLLGLGIKYANKHTIKTTSLLVRTTTNRTQVYNGTDENDNIQRITNLRWQERQLFFNQIKGTHKIKFIKNLELDWNISLFEAKMTIPDERTYTYFLRETTGQYYNPINIPMLNMRHEFTYLNDTGNDIKIDLKIPITKKENFIKLGINKQSKKRNSKVKRFTYAPLNPPQNLAYEDIDTIFSPENVEKYFNLQNRTYFNDKYYGNLDINAFYLLTDFKLLKNLRFLIGTRFENLKENVLSYEQQSPKEIRSNINVNGIYPSLAITYMYNKKLQFRTAYSKTMTYPDFLELSNSVYIDPLTSERILGNPELTESTIHNFDFRTEYYINSLDHISVALFYKNIINPIEQTYLPTSNRPFLSFQNAENANNYGVEFEFRKSWDFINNFSFKEKIPYVKSINFDNFFISGNISVIKSEISLNPEKSSILTTKKRQMQGQSPYIINLSFGYDNVKTGLYWGILFNTFGKRIRAVGIYGQPDQYEQPFNQLDFVFRKKWKDKYSISLKVKNMLNDDVLITQGDKITLRYKKGISISIGSLYKF